MMAMRFARAVSAFALLVLLAGCLAQSPSAGTFPGDRRAQALADAAAEGDVDEIRYLMKEKRIDPDVLFASDGTPLLAWPILKGNPAGLKAMLENGANPNARFPVPRIRVHDDGSYGVSFRNNAMVWAAKSEDLVYLNLLLDHGGDPNTRTSNDETLMKHAFLSGIGWRAVKLLVERGADVNSESQSMTMLDSYTGKGGFQAAFWLLEHGADPTINHLRHPGAPPDQSHIIDDIFWYPSQPDFIEWQRKCQQWLLARGHKRPPMPERIRRMRQAFGYPSEEKEIPLL